MNTALRGMAVNNTVQKLQDATYQETVQCVNEAIDRGITRIKRSVIVERLIKVITGFAGLSSEFTPSGKTTVLDTVAARFTITINGPNNFTIAIEGNDELSTKLVLVGINNVVSLNGNGIELPSLVVMVTSLLLKNSQDSNGQFVEVFTKS